MKNPFAGRDEAGLVRHGSLLVAGSLVGAVFNAGFHMAMGRPQVLPNAEYGSLVAMLGIVLAAGTPMMAVQNTLAHFISRFEREGRRDEALGLFRHWLELFLALGAAIATAAFWFRVPLAAFWGGVDPRLVAATFAVLAASLWMNVFYGLLQGLQMFGWLAWVPQAWGATRLLLGVAFAVWISSTALSAIAAQGVGVAAVLALCAWAVRGVRLPPRAPAGARPRGTYRYLGASLACLGGYAALMNLDTALAKTFFDGETVGLFAKAATIARIAVFLPVPVAMALFPKVSTSGELTDASWRLLLRALGFAGAIIAAVAGVCLLAPQLPWTILSGPRPAAEAALAAALTRAMVAAMAPLAMAYLLLNFEMAQRRFRSASALVACGAAYVGGVALFHGHPLHLAAVLGAANVAALAALAGGVAARRRAARKGA